MDEGLTGSYSGPEVGFEEISIDLPQAHFWITSGLASSRHDELF